MQRSKTHFPQVPLAEVKQLLPKRRYIRRPNNVSVERQKGNSPYSIPLSTEPRMGNQISGSEK